MKILGRVEILVASAPAPLHDVQRAQAIIHVTYVCVRKVNTMYIYNLYMDQKSFEGPLNDRMWRNAVALPAMHA